MNNPLYILKTLSNIANELIKLNPMKYDIPFIMSWLNEPRKLTVEHIGFVEATGDKDNTIYTIQMRLVDDDVIEVVFTISTLCFGIVVSKEYAPQFKTYLNFEELGSMLINLYYQIRNKQIIVYEYKITKYNEKFFTSILHTLYET